MKWAKTALTLRLSFNRTFMELKWEKATFSHTLRARFNRTFMELKWAQRQCFSLPTYVLIVPLWN